MLGFWFGGGGCGTSASRPFGVRGVITMKMMISTSSTSIMGVMLMSALGPPPGPPTAIPIRLLLYDSNSAWAGAVSTGTALTLAGRPSPPLRRCGLLARSRRRAARISTFGFFLDLLGEQPQVVHARGPQIVHHVHHALIAGARIGLYEY